MPSKFYLGYGLARQIRSNLDIACDAADADADELDVFALRTITEDNRGQLRSALSSFFGSTGALFWALYSAIWPDFNEAMMELADRTLASTDDGDMAEQSALWQFVSDGWCDAADNY
jgi:hypothetical protein